MPDNPNVNPLDALAAAVADLLAQRAADATQAQTQAVNVRDASAVQPPDSEAPPPPIQPVGTQTPPFSGAYDHAAGTNMQRPSASDAGAPTARPYNIDDGDNMLTWTRDRINRILADKGQVEGRKYIRRKFDEQMAHTIIKLPR